MRERIPRTAWPPTAAPSWASSPTARTAVVTVSTGPGGVPPASSGVAQPAGGGASAATGLGFLAAGRGRAGDGTALRSALPLRPAAAFAFAAGFGVGLACAFGEGWAWALAAGLACALAAGSACAFGAAFAFAAAGLA